MISLFSFGLFVLCISLLDPSLHNPNAQSHQAVQKLSIYVIETARMMLRPPIETISAVFDMSSFSMSNMVNMSRIALAYLPIYRQHTYALRC